MASEAVKAYQGKDSQYNLNRFIYNLKLNGRYIGMDSDLLPADPEIDPNLKILKAIPVLEFEDVDGTENTRREARKQLIRSFFKLSPKEYILQSRQSHATGDRIRAFLQDPGREADRAVGEEYILMQTKENVSGPKEYQLWGYKPR